MSATTSIQPYDWVKQISPALMQLDEKPLFGAAPPFPWESLTTELAHVFEIEDLKIQPTDMQWREGDQVLSSLGGDIVPTYFGIAALEGFLCWVMPKSEITALMTTILTEQPQALKVIDEEVEKGFYRFLITQVIQSVRSLDFDSGISPNILNNNALPHEPAFCIDVSITAKHKNFKGRLIIPPEMRKSWKERYADHKLGVPYQSPLASKLQVIVNIEIGKTKLSPSEWKQISTGDYLILDHCSYEPDTDKGRVMLTINGVPMFRAKLKQGNIKILEFPLYHEVDTSMNNNKSEDDDLEDFDDDLHEDTDLEEHEEVEEEFHEDTVEEVHEEEHEEAHEKEAATAQKPPSEIVEGKKGGVNVNELPLSIIVEVGRLQMSVQKLMELQPGNMLELDIRPENGVDLVVNGRRIAKGELLRIGDTLGVRILDIS